MLQVPSVLSRSMTAVRWRVDRLDCGLPRTGLLVEEGEEEGEVALVEEEEEVALVEEVEGEVALVEEEEEEEVEVGCSVSSDITYELYSPFLLFSPSCLPLTPLFSLLVSLPPHLSCSLSSPKRWKRRNSKK